MILLASLLLAPSRSTTRSTTLRLHTLYYPETAPDATVVRSYGLFPETEEQCAQGGHAVLCPSRPLLHPLYTRKFLQVAPADRTGSHGYVRPPFHLELS